jgi:hypothetical protein
MAVLYFVVEASLHALLTPPVPQRLKQGARYRQMDAASAVVIADLRVLVGVPKVAD